MSSSGTGQFGAPQTTNWGTDSAPWYCPEIVDDSNASSLKLHNTLTGRKDVFVPMKGREVRWYTCGPTVYDSSHVGHARTYLSLDIMRRIMTDYFHYHVIYQLNITDIDDKIILRARQNLLVSNLKKDGKTLEEVKELIDTAITEATDAAVSKQEELEHDLAEVKDDSRAKTELEGLLEQQKLKRSNLDKCIHSIQDASDASVDTLIDIASMVLAPKLDREKGGSVTDHSVFLEHARKYEKEFMDDMRALGVREPDVLTRVTEYIPEIIAFIDKLVKRNMAYASPTGSVYLSLDAFQNAGHHYRKLSGGSSNTTTSAAEMAEGEGALASGATDEKRNPNDFVLWKASKPGEPAWESPWGSGRPGWHIECSVVASDILGERLDIHSGGEDLKFPHHDNELAQSEACLGTHCGGGHDKDDECHQWVNYFTHTGHLHIEGLKMSKSLKNFVTIRQALEQNSSRLLRLLFLLAGGWDQPMNYSQQTVEDARSKETTFKSFFRQVEALSRNFTYYDHPVGWTNRDDTQNLDHDVYQSLLNTQKIVHESLLDNFNTKDAMLALLNIISDANAYIRNPNVVRPAVLTLKAIAVYVTQILKVFGVVQGNDDFGFELQQQEEKNSNNKDAMIQTLVSFREQVRNQALAAVKQKNNDNSANTLTSILQTCDALRDELLPTLGVRLEDRNNGSMWNSEDPKVLLRELAEKKERDLAAKRKKLSNQVAAKQKELNKVQDAAKDPLSLFKDDTTLYKEWDPVTGLPTVNADGTAVSAGQTKKKKKAMDKHTKLHKDLLAKTDNAPNVLIEKLTRELEAMTQQMNE